MGETEKQSGGSWITIEDDTTWPSPERAGELEYMLRYGVPANGIRELKGSEALALASICCAYVALCTRGDFARKPAMIRRALKRLRTDSAVLPSTNEEPNV